MVMVQSFTAKRYYLLVYLVSDAFTKAHLCAHQVCHFPTCFCVIRFNVDNLRL